MRVMASGSKWRRTEYFSVKQVLELREQDDDSDGGMSSGEESDLDRQFENESCESHVVWKLCNEMLFSLPTFYIVLKPCSIA